MIQGLTGIPGGGKTYYAVFKILQLLDKGEIVVHNIHGLTDARATAWDFSQIPLDAESLFKAFDLLRLQKNVPPETVIHVFIDEAQRYWPYEYKDARGVFFFDYHRHHGLQITLITQDIKKISIKISTLFEQEIRALKPMFQLTPGFSYNLLSSGEMFGKERLPKKKEVFDSYTSFVGGTGSAKKSRYIYAIPVAIIFAIVMFFVLQYSLRGSFTKLGKDAAIASDSVSKVSSAPSPLSMPSDSRRDLGGGVSTDSSGSDSQPVVEYLGPSVVGHRGPYVSVNSTEGLVTEILFSKFLEDYPPTIYGYSYVSAPHKNRFILMDRYSSKILYPIEQTVARRVFIKSSDPKLEPVPVPDVYAAMPSETVGHGYSSDDRRLLSWLSQVARGLNPAPLADLKSVPAPLTDVPVSTQTFVSTSQNSTK